MRRGDRENPNQGSVRGIIRDSAAADKDGHIRLLIKKGNSTRISGIDAFGYYPDYKVAVFNKSSPVRVYLDRVVTYNGPAIPCVI